VYLSAGSFFEEEFVVRRRSGEEMGERELRTDKHESVRDVMIAHMYHTSIKKK
jgi:hypothetical protein